MSYSINFSELWTYAPSDAEHKLPVSALPDDGAAHIHGRLEIIVGGRALPHLGYWGPKDVCLGQWLQVLRDAVKALGAAPKSEYTYDEGEQGQPAFHWKRIDDKVFVSITDSVLSDGRADPTWNEVAFEYDEFVQEFEMFQSSLRVAVSKDAPVGGSVWFNQHLLGAA
jgi:hypothetical protein